MAVAPSPPEKASALNQAANLKWLVKGYAGLGRDKGRTPPIPAVGPPPRLKKEGGEARAFPVPVSAIVRRD